MDVASRLGVESGDGKGFFAAWVDERAGLSGAYAENWSLPVMVLGRSTKQK